MLRLQDLGATFGVLVVEEALAFIEGRLVPELLDIVRRKPVAPRECQRHLVGAVVLDMALRANVAAHLRAICINVRVVGLGTRAFPPFLHRGQVRNLGVALGQRLDAVDEAGTRHAQRHRIRVVAVHARDGMSVPHVGLLLVDEHVRVPTPVAVVDGECVTAEHALQPRVTLDLLLGQRFAAAVTAEARAGCLGRAQIRVVLLRKVDAPLGGVRRVFGHFGQANESLRRLGLALENVDEKRCYACRRDRHDHDECQYAARGPSA